MITLAANLSTGFGFVHVDFYNVKGRVYVGEFPLYTRQRDD